NEEGCGIGFVLAVDEAVTVDRCPGFHRRIFREQRIHLAGCLYGALQAGAAGMNTDAMTRTTAMSEVPISSMALMVASLGGRWDLAIFRSTFSTTTIASSTTMPMASTMPNKVNKLMEKPRASIPANVPISETKIATVQMIVERKLCRNR